MFGILLTLVAAGVVVWFVFKNYYPQTVLLLVGLVTWPLPVLWVSAPLMRSKAPNSWGLTLWKRRAGLCPVAWPSLG